MGIRSKHRLALGLLALAVFALVAAACTKEAQVITKEVIVEKVVIKEVPVEVIVEKEVVRTVEVIKEVPVEVEVVKEVIKEVVVEKEVVKIVEKQVFVDIGKVEEKVLQVRMSSMPANFSPHTQGSGALAQVFGWMYSRLAQADPQTAQWAPDLAERWELAPDFSSMTFFLRKSAVWHDGTPVTAKDIEFTVRSFLNPEESSWMLDSYTSVRGGQDFQDGLRNDVPGVVIIDDHTVRLEFENPNAFFLDDLNNLCGLAPNPILPAHLLDQIPTDELFEDDFWLNSMIGSGPFKFVQWVPDQFMEMEAFDLFYFGRPKIDRIIMSVIPSGDATQIAMQRGEIDVTVRGSVSEDAQESMLMDPRFDVYATMGVNSGGFSFNMRVPTINDPRLHQAFAYGIDRRALFQQFARGLGRINHTVMAHSWYQKPEWEALYPFDPDKARSLLKEMSWDSSRAIKVNTGPITNESTQARYAAIQQYLEDVGIKIEFRTLGRAESFQSFYVDHDWEITFGGGGGIQGGPAQYLGGRWTTCPAPSCDPWGYAEYLFPKWDELVKEGSLITDRAEAARFWQMLNEDYMLKDLPILGTWISAGIKVKGKRFFMPVLGEIPKPSSGRINDIPIYPVHIGRDDNWGFHIEQWELR